MAGLFDDVVPQAATPEGEQPPAKPGLFSDVLHPASAAQGGLFGDVLGKQPDPDTSKIDLSAPVGSEGFVGGLADVGRGLAHGVMTDLPQQVGQSAQNFGRELGNQDLAKWGDETVAAAQARDAAHPEFRQSIIGQRDADNPLSVRGGAYGAGSNTPLSTGPGLAAAGVGAGIGALAGPGGALAGAGIGYVVGSLASLPLFYGGQGQQSYEEIKKRLTAAGGHTPEEIEHAATVGGRISGGIEAGGELAEDFIPFHQLFHPLAKPVKGMLVKSLFQGGLRKAAATIGEQELGEVSTETAQQYFEDETEGRYGGGQGGTLKGAAQVIMPTALMTLLPGGLTAIHNFRSAHQLQSSLTDGAVNPEQRAAAAKVVFHEISGTHGDEDTAQAFDQYATVQIARGAPIELGSDEFYKKQIERPDYQAALDHLEENTGDFAGAQRALDEHAPPPDYGVQEGDVEHIDAAPPPDTTPGYTVHELAPDTPLGNAAAIAQATGAAQNAAAARQTEVDESAHAAAGENATAGDSEPPAPPSANPITGALFPFATAKAAQSRAQLLQEQTGEDHEVIPHPFKHDAFAVVPKAIEAAPAPGDTQGESDAVQLPAAGGPQETPRAERPGENVEGHPADESGPQGPGESPGSAAQDEKAVGQLPTEPRDWPKRERQAAARDDPQGYVNQRVLDVLTDFPRATLKRIADNIGDPNREGYGMPEELVERAVKAHLAAGTLTKHAGGAYTLTRPPASTPGNSEIQGVEARIPAPGTAPNAHTPTDQALSREEPSIENPPAQGNLASGETQGAGSIDQAAAAAASNPTPGQVEAGNYQKGHITVHGLDVSIENPEGSTRRSKPGITPAWETAMVAHYGYIRGTIGKDGDHVDAFVKPGTTAEHNGAIYVIDQPGARGFDEHKALIGYRSQADAVKSYLAHYPEGHKVGPVTRVTPEQFKDWLATGDTTKPFAQQATDRKYVPLGKVGDTVAVYSDAKTAKEKAEHPDGYEQIGKAVMSYNGESTVKLNNGKTVRVPDWRVAPMPAVEKPGLAKMQQAKVARDLPEGWKLNLDGDTYHLHAPDGTDVYQFERAKFDVRQNRIQREIAAWTGKQRAQGASAEDQAAEARKRADAQFAEHGPRLAPFQSAEQQQELRDALYERGLAGVRGDDAEIGRTAERVRLAMNARDEAATKATKDKDAQRAAAAQQAQAALTVSAKGPWDFENSWPEPIPDEEMERAGRQGFRSMQEDVEGGADLAEAVASTLTETANDAIQHLHTIRALQDAIKTGIPPGKEKPLPEAKLVEQRKKWLAELRQARQDYQDQVAAVEEYFPHAAVQAWSQWVGRTFAEQQPEFEKEPTPEQRAQMDKARTNDEAKMARVGKAKPAKAAPNPTVEVKVIEAESGQQAIVQMPATDALKHYDEQLDKAQGMLQCLLS